MPTRLSVKPLEKTPTGIFGLDEITAGGLPKNRPSLICGGAGSGKTMIAMEFLIHGALEYNEPGVFMSFEENEQELATNVSSLGFNLSDLTQKTKSLLILFLLINLKSRRPASMTWRDFLSASKMR